MDYLVPFLAQMGNPKTLSKNQAVKLQKECLEDLKQRLIEQANLIQERFDQETLKLQEKQQEYQQKQVKFTVSHHRIKRILKKSIQIVI